MAVGKQTAVIWAISITVIVLFTGCQSVSKRQTSSDREFKARATAHKPVVAVIIDSIMDKTLQVALNQGRVPALKFLIDHGQYFPRVVSSFPTMSVTIDSTFLTGGYADRHQIPGLVWYSEREKRMIFYGNGFKEALKIDQLQVLTDSVYQLNQVQLSRNVKTIHEELADSGKQSASINAVIFRGPTERDLPVPESMARSSRLPDHYKITAPALFSLAAFAHLNPENARHTAVWEKYGMNDKFTAREIAYLVKQGKLPDVTIAYLPENDTITHLKGSTVVKGLEKTDQALRVILDAYGSWEKAIAETAWVVLGDSAQSDVLKRRDNSLVDLRPLLSSYRIARLNRPVGQEDQIVIAANERMAYIYAISPALKLTEIVKSLQAEEKLDLIAVNEGDSVRLTAGGQGDRFLSFHSGGPYTDEYGQEWTLLGDPALADITIQDNKIKYGQYPDVLARLNGALHSHEGQYAVVTVKPGYELIGESSPAHHGGGAHGSLHEVDSVVPLIVAGTDSRPPSLRTVDMKDWILKMAAGK